MEKNKLNEDCGCGKSSGPATQISRPSSRELDSSVGKFASLADGRKGKINDSIRNSRGEVIGYVMNNEKGSFRVFKDKVTQIFEDGGAMASLGTTIGMGDVSAPTRTSTGSGDQFPAITAGTSSAKKGKKKNKKEEKKEKDPISMGLMDWNDFKKNMVKNQFDYKGVKNKPI